MRVCNIYSVSKICQQCVNKLVLYSLAQPNVSFYHSHSQVVPLLGRETLKTYLFNTINLYYVAAKAKVQLCRQNSIDVNK